MRTDLEQLYAYIQKSTPEMKSVLSDTTDLMEVAVRQDLEMARRCLSAANITLPHTNPEGIAVVAGARKNCIRAAEMWLQRAIVGFGYVSSDAYNQLRAEFKDVLSRS